MLNIKFDKNRPKGDGQYFVELISQRILPWPEVGYDRLGYWCDDIHLKLMADKILSQIKSDV